MGAGFVRQQNPCARDNIIRACGHRRTGVVGGCDTAGKEHRPATDHLERARQERRRRGVSRDVSARLAALCDQAIGAAGNRPACLLVGADHDENGYAMLGEPSHQ
jgi:hypothetical protein